MRRLALTSWSAHHLLTGKEQPALTLFELPARMQAAGIDTLEICHFHIPDISDSTLRQLRAAIDDAGVEPFSILIDMGDISSADADRRAADMAAIEGWIDVAARLGTRAVRVVGGEAPPDDEAAFGRAADALQHLGAYANARGVRALTENFKALLSTAQNCNRMLDRLGGAVGLCADIGNFPAARRVDEFRLVAAQAESIHVKGAYSSAGALNRDELQACLEASLMADFSGPYTLVYDRGGDTWAGVAELAELVRPYLRS
jgi:sugar phosphate isomerase/epimerase